MLLAIIVLAMLRVPKLKMPPPFPALLPARVELVTVALPRFKIPPPSYRAELPKRVELVRLRVLPLRLRIPPPSLSAVLPERVELVRAREPLL